MNPRSAAWTFVEGIGVAAIIVAVVALAAAGLVALGLPSESRADDPPPAVPAQPRPEELVVAVALGDPVLQAGVVRDNEVVLARGLEVEIARNLARRLGIPHVRFVYVRPVSRLLVAKTRPWHLTIASIRPGRGVSSSADLSDPYLVTDQAVVLRHGRRPLATLAELRHLLTCAVRGSRGAEALATVAPVARPILPLSSERLLQLVETGVCDAALVDADGVGQFVAGRGVLLGPVTARVVAGRGYVVAVTRGGPIAVAEVDRALARMRADGTLHRLVRQWLGIDPWRLRVLR